MKKYRSYWFLSGIILLFACNTNSKKLNERVSLWRNDKIPYGTYYAFENLSHVFPEADIEISKKSPDKYHGLNFGETPNTYNENEEKSAHIVISPQVVADANEINALFRYIGEGNHVFISAFRISENLLDSLQLKTAWPSAYFNSDDSLTVSIINPVTFDSLSFSYPGMAIDNYFVSIDSDITNIAGRNKNGKINYVRLTYEGGGSINIHLAPMAFTNFFLLHHQNKLYYDNVLSYLPHDIKQIKWDDYFRNKTTQKAGFSKLAAFLNNEILKWAFWLVILLFAIIYLFESKRKQRIVPVVPPLKNTSLDFVKTIGRLYYQRKDNKNLAIKMSAHFLDIIRNRYHITTSVLNEEFENKLAYKSGYDLAATRDIIYTIKTLPDQVFVSDEELLHFNNRIEKFIQHH